MVFSDASFLFLFLPLALAAGVLLRRVAFAPAVLAASLIFYYWTGGAAILILIGSIVINYAGGVAIAANRRRLILAVFVALNLLLLGYFKYAGFLAVNVSALAGGSVPTFLAAIALPVGISFFTFQGISYLIDVWRGDIPAERDPAVFGAYISFFPQLIAGPIVRYRDVAADFHAPGIGIDRFAAGAARFAHGLLKKVLIADNVAGIANAVFGLAPGDLNLLTAWCGALAFAVQIYFDFSGYSDMAIGLGEMFGIAIPENFRHPYSSRSITEFWRRWHISLSTWFRDYLYIPLGGNRRGSIVTYGNLLIVFLLVGFWHGAAWNFVVWGLYNGCFLILERIVFRNRDILVRERERDSIGTILARLLYCAPVVLVGWAIFRAPDLSSAAAFIAAMFSPAGAMTLPDSVVAALAPPLSLGALVVGSLAFLLPPRPSLGYLLGRTDLSPWGEVASLLYCAAACVIAGILILPGGYSPFLYFRF